MQNNKKYWLRGGCAFFFLGMILMSYSAFHIFQNQANFRATGQTPQLFDIAEYLHLIPGLNYLRPFAYGGTIGIIIGVIILSIVYGFIGLVIGYLYGKIKNRNKV